MLLRLTSESCTRMSLREISMAACCSRICAVISATARSCFSSCSRNCLKLGRICSRTPRVTRSEWRASAAWVTIAENPLQHNFHYYPYLQSAGRTDRQQCDLPVNVTPQDRHNQACNVCNITATAPTTSQPVATCLVNMVGCHHGLLMQRTLPTRHHTYNTSL